jgi:probable HAF family extracellular repeat protein
MKSRTWMWMTAVSLFAALAIPVGMAAQDSASPDNNRHQHHRYRLIDLGTFGGPASYIEVNGYGNKVLNNRGIFTGWADTSAPDPFAPNCYDPDCYIARTFKWTNGRKTKLGVLASGYSSASGAINESGWIVGQSQNGLIDPLISFPETRAVLWTNRGITDLGTFGGNESLAVYVNDAGQVVGLATNAIPDPYSLFGWGDQIRTFLWQNGVKRDIGTLGGPDAVPSAGCTNQRTGLIAGQSYTSFIPNPTTGVPTIDPFLWINGRMLDLGTLGGTNGFAQCANNRGQVTGQSNLGGDLTFHPFFWDRGVLTDLGTLGGDTGTSNWMNEDGDVVGKADLPGSQTHDGFLWKHGTMTDLGTVTGDPCSNATSINENRQVVGNSSDCVNPLHAFLWENGGPMVDLDSLIPANSSLQLVNAEDINEQGEIAGLGVPAGCQPTDLDACGHAFLLLPCDEHHPGQCEDDSMVEVPDTVPAGRFSVAMTQPLNDVPSGRLNPLRNPLRNPLTQHPRIAGQRPIQRD